MPRIARIKSENLTYHVISRGNNKMKTFHQEVDYRKYLEIVDKYHEKFSFRLYHFCLMPNHVHLLLKCEDDLSELMHGINLCYAQYYKKKYNADLIIIRRQLLQLPQLTLLFAPPELNSEDYLRVTKESEESPEVTISFTSKGMKTLLFQMLNRRKLERFELVYVDDDKIASIPYVVVYKLKKDSLP